MSFSGLCKCHEILVSWMFCLNLYLEGKLPVILNVLSKPDVISVEVYVVVTLSRKGPENSNIVKMTRLMVMPCGGQNVGLVLLRVGKLKQWVLTVNSWDHLGYRVLK